MVGAEFAVDEGVPGAGPDGCGEPSYGLLELSRTPAIRVSRTAACSMWRRAPSVMRWAHEPAARGTAVVDEADLAEGGALLRVQGREFAGQPLQGGAPGDRVPLQGLLQAAAPHVLDDHGVRGSACVVGVQEAGGADAGRDQPVVGGREHVEAGAGEKGSRGSEGPASQ